MAVGRTFLTPGSPLRGLRVPADWGRLSLLGKRAALVRVGYARDLTAAASMLGKHAAAARAAKAKRDRRRWLAMAEMQDVWWNK
jgi:hypothetical protein